LFFFSFKPLSKRQGLKIEPDDPVLKRNHKTVDHAIKREKGIKIEEEEEEEEKPRFRWWSEPKKVVTESKN
jgi:RecA-family ATPase